MNRLSNRRRAQILTLLVEGCGINSAARISGAAHTTVLRLLAEAGRFSEIYHHYRLRDLPCWRIEADEVWAFVGAKERNARQPGHGDVWTFTAICPDTKLGVAWAVGDQEIAVATRVMLNVAARVGGRIQLSTDKHSMYPAAVRAAFDHHVDYAQIGKEFNPAKTAVTGVHKVRGIGDPDPRYVSTSMVERANLTMRGRMRRFTRKTTGFSRKRENHAHAVSLHFLASNFVFPHGTLSRRAGVPTTPAMAAMVAERPWTMLEVARRMDGSYQLAA